MLTSTYLVVLIEPKESEVGDSNRLPVVLNLLAGAVDDVGYFVGNDKLQVLQQQRLKDILKNNVRSGSI